jgi:hypothetical protein
MEFDNFSHNIYMIDTSSFPKFNYFEEKNLYQIIIFFSESYTKLYYISFYIINVIFNALFSINS